MASPYVFSNYTLQYLASNIATRFRMYAAIYNPIQIKTISQDVQIDQYGQYVNVSNIDLLANHLPPYAPQANMGANRIGFVGESLLFDGSTSTQRNNLSATNHTWSATGGATITTYNYLGVSDQAQMVWTNPGLYTVTLTVTDRFGSTHSALRQVWIYQDREHAPQGAIQLTSLTGSIQSGGWNGQITTAQSSFNVALPDALPIGYFVPITIMTETEYEITPGNWVPAQIGPYGAPIPGQFYDDPRITFYGYIQTGSAIEDDQSDTVQFTIQTIDMILQQAGIHNIGYYNASYHQRVGNEPVNQNNSKVGKGQLVTDLTSEDVYRSLLCGYIDTFGNSQGGHSNIGQYHDVVIWRDFLPVPNAQSQLYYLTYSTLTANEGMIWDAILTMAQNEFASIWCEREGSICIGPTYNMRGYEMMNTSTDVPYFPLSQIISANELNKNTTWAAQTAYLHNFFGPNPIPVHYDFAYAPYRDLSTLLGPPIVAHFSDVPVYDTGMTAPTGAGLFPWVAQNWPQDLSIRPIQGTVTENYTTRTAFVKLVATLVNAQTVWSAWYPTNTFSSTGLMTNATAAGTWTVTDNILLADLTIAANKPLSWQYLWEMARRNYLQQNQQYTVNLTFGMLNWIRLNDLFLYTRQRAEDGPQLRAAPFVVTDITFSIDLDNQTWQTSLNANQVSSFGIGPIITPPFNAPK